MRKSSMALGTFKPVPVGVEGIEAAGGVGVGVGVSVGAGTGVGRLRAKLLPAPASKVAPRARADDLTKKLRRCIKKQESSKKAARKVMTAGSQGVAARP